jgi:hypothetical protein
MPCNPRKLLYRPWPRSQAETFISLCEPKGAWLPAAFLIAHIIERIARSQTNIDPVFTQARVYQYSCGGPDWRQRLLWAGWHFRFGTISEAEARSHLIAPNCTAAERTLISINIGKRAPLKPRIAARERGVSVVQTAIFWGFVRT